MDYFPCVVIGAGVIGISVARELALRGRDVLVLEAAEQIGTGTSSRNSEVIHAGIYYPTDSLKARLCVRGKSLLYQYCEARGVPFRRCGKLIVATDDSQLGELQRIRQQAWANGVGDLQQLDAAEVAALEPALYSVGALLSPSTGIIDSHQLMLQLQADAEAAGAIFVMRTPLQSARLEDDGIVLELGGVELFQLRVGQLVNAAGLQAQAVAQAIQGLPTSAIPPGFFAKGNYYALRGKANFRHLIYPVPEPGGLGVHITLDMAGQVRFGPDVEWIEKPDYRVDPGRSQSFYAAVRRYWPQLPDDSLHPTYAGVRPKLSGPGQPAADFLIQGPQLHGVPGLVNLFGIESPGLTACLAIAETVADLLQT